MSEVTLHATPRLSDVVLEQMRIVALAFRREAYGLAIFIAIGTLVVGTAIVRGDAASWFDSDEWVPVTWVAFLFSFAAWWKERPFESTFLWTLPVDRRRIAAAKVFAGWVWLMTALALLIAWQKALAMISRVEGAETMPAVAFIGTTAAYLLGSAVILGLRYPLRWLLGAVGLLFLLGGLDEVLSMGPYGIERLLRSTGLIHVVDNATIFSFLCLGAGFIALMAAISRHQENR